MQKTKNIDGIIEQNLQEVGCNLVRTSARLANQKIHESFVNLCKRKASESIEKDTEIDEIFADTKDSSVGTTIKREATRLYEQYYSLSYEDKTVVALGLNSILDLSYHATPQKRLFSQKDWRILRNIFQKCFNRGVTLDSKLEKRISKVEEITKKEIPKGRFLCLKYEAKAKSQIESDIFSIYSQYLELLEFHSYVFEKNIDITESDVIVKMWSPILERLFRRTVLRTKWGDSIGDSNDVTSSPGFKVDLRILKDTLSRRRKEADKANVEMTRINPSLVKVTTDRTKLYIESKIVLDKLLKEIPESAQDISIPSLQITGSKVTLCSLKLGANGLYVAVKEGVAVIPNHASHIKDFREIIMLLFKFKNATTDIASLSLRNDCDSSGSNNSGNRDSGGYASWVRGTWIFPNPNKKTKLPKIPDALYFSDSINSI